MNTVIEALMNLPTEKLKAILEYHRSLEEAQKRVEDLRNEIISLLKSEDIILRSEAKRKPLHRGRTILDIVTEAMRETKKPLSRQEIAEIIQKSGYPTRSKNLPAQLGVLLYGSKSSMFKRVGRGRFVLASSYKKAS